VFRFFRPAIASPVTLRTLIGLGLAVFAVAFFCEDWLAGAAVVVLWLAWQLLRFPDGPPVLAFAFTFHWSQIVCGMFYNAATGHVPMAMTAPKYREMMMVGLGCIVCLTLGIVLGERIVRQRMQARPHNYGFVVGTPALIAAYVASVVGKNVILQFAGDVPALGQGIVALTYFRLALLYLVVRRFIQADRFVPAGMLILVEVALGFTGFFAEFREPLFIAIICAIELFDGRRTKHWAAIAALVALSLSGGILWMGIRSPLRRDIDPVYVGQTKAERLSYVATLASDWVRKGGEDKQTDFDAFIDRLWDIYYPALALDRVPDVVPHENGAIFMGALQHIFSPRIFFPNKAEIESDSYQVRRYSGVFVAGPERGTTIAFGYAIQSYIDFGYPWMFLPVLVYGVFMGAAFRWFLTIIRNHELAIAVVTVIFWMSLYPFNRSWPKLLGLSGTLMIYLGGAVVLLDRYLSVIRGAASYGAPPAPAGPADPRVHGGHP
jgi:hypothetical protein